MSNNYFQFKQFRIEQGACGMKVSTDACVQGAWVPVPPGTKNILDIGTGTGLLSLMLAQRFPDVQIDAVEIDSYAAQQAKENFKASDWTDRLALYQGDIRFTVFTKKYDFIICNPPFFINSLLGNKEERNQARHTLSLTFRELFLSLERLLSPGGQACILLPVAEYEVWCELVRLHNWNVFHLLNVYPRIHQKPNRVISLISAGPNRCQQTESLIIRNTDNSYTEEFTSLMQPFYLKL